MKLLLPALTFLAAILSSCTLIHKMQGNLDYGHLAYTSASHHFEKYLAKKTDYEMLRKLGDCYARNNEVKKAEQTFRRLAQSGLAVPGDKLQLAHALKQLQQYPEAKQWYELYLMEKPGDQVARFALASCDSMESLKRDSFLMEVKKLPGPVNTDNSNYSPAFSGQGIMFVSERSEKVNPKIAEWTGQPYTDIYYAEMDGDSVKVSPRKADGKMDGLYHEGPLSFTPSGDKVYFTRSNYLRRRRGKSEEYVNNLKIFEATRTAEGYDLIAELPFNSDEFSCGHPALSPDGMVMFFVSDQPGGQGGTDLYMSERRGGSWTAPVNLGADVNTAGNEMFPWVSSEGLLYFASDGWPGLGGLDIFASAPAPNSWTAPVNLRYPINSSRDDFGYIAAPDGKSGYFSTNRDRVQGVDDIYMFKRIEQKFLLEGVVVLKGTTRPIKGSLVELRLADGKPVSAILTDNEGHFSFGLQQSRDYAVHGSKEDYFGTSKTLSTMGERRSKNYFITLELDTLIIGKPIVLNNIYYDFDKWFIRPDAEPDLNHLVQVMKDNPGILVELGSHTDCRGTNKYNETLSQNRAQSAVDYIIEHGIDQSRIYAKGYGETVLVNHCNDRNKNKCSEEEHQLNRRTEFKVVSKLPEQ